jgi:hypothetical protein
MESPQDWGLVEIGALQSIIYIGSSWRSLMQNSGVQTKLAIKSYG